MKHKQPDQEQEYSIETLLKAGGNLLKKFLFKINVPISDKQEDNVERIKQFIVDFQNKNKLFYFYRFF